MPETVYVAHVTKGGRSLIGVYRTLQDAMVAVSDQMTLRNEPEVPGSEMVWRCSFVDGDRSLGLRCTSRADGDTVQIDEEEIQ